MTDRPPAPSDLPARADAGQRSLALLAFLGIAALNLQLWGIDHPPLIDWANHLARHGIHCAAPGFDGQAAYYSFRLALVPNLSGDLLHVLPRACADLLRTRMAEVQWATTGLVAGTVVLHRAIWGRWSAWPAAAALVSYPMVLSFGFENYLLAATCVPWALALWVVLERRAPGLAVALFLPLAAGLYVLHLYAFGFFGAVLGARAAGQAWARRGEGLRALGPLAAVAAIGVVPLGHLAWLMAGAGGLEPGNLDYGGFWQKLAAILSPAIPVTFMIDPPALRLSATLPLAAILLGAVWLRRSGRWPRVAPGWGPALLGGLALTVAMPFILDGIWFSDIRFPYLLACLALAATDPRLAPRRMALLVLALLCVTGLRSATMAADWRAHDAETRVLLSALAPHLGPGDRLATARAGEGRRVFRHSNSSALVGAVTGAHVPSLFQGANTLAPRPEVGTRHVKQGLMEEIGTLIDEAAGRPIDIHPYMRDWRSYYSHLLLLGDIATAPPVPNARVLAEADWFRLYRLEGNQTRATGAGSRLTGG